MAEQLDREIERLEARLDRASGAVDELATIRRGLDRCERGTGIALTDVRIGFACKQRWDDMVGDDRVRACAGCDRPVFNLSAMTRAEAEAVLATRGLTPCVRFYRRPDGTVMTSDCPSASAPRGVRRLAIASSVAGATLAASPAFADPQPETPSEVEPTDDPPPAEPAEPIRIEPQILMGLPVTRTFETITVEMGGIAAVERKRPAVEWSVWGRIGGVVAQRADGQRPDVVARSVTPPAGASAPTWEAAAAADLTLGVARDGNLRLGAWGEVRTSSGPVAGAELVLEGLPPHPYGSRIGGTGSLVVRAGANDRVITGALGFGYVGSFTRIDPWISWARHVVGARAVLSVNRAIDDPRAWSATIGLEIEPIGAARAVLDLARGR